MDPAGCVIAPVEAQQDRAGLARVGPVAIGDESANHLVAIGRRTDPAVHEQHRIAGIGLPQRG